MCFYFLWDNALEVIRMSDNSHVLYATLKGLKLEISETQIPEGNFNSVKLILSKSLEWKDLLLCLNVLYSDNQSAQFEIQEDEVELSNVFTRSGLIQLGIVGMKQEGDIVKASNLVALNVTEGGYIVNAGVDASDYTLAERVFLAVQEANTARNEANEARDKALECEGLAAENADKSKSHADEAAEYKNATETSAKNALEYASNSENSAKEAYSALEQVQAEKAQILSVVGNINELLYQIVAYQEVHISE